MSGLPKTYKVYRFDPSRGEVSADFIKATHDEEAVALADADRLGAKCEIWDERRMVAQLSGAAEGASPNTA